MKTQIISIIVTCALTIVTMPTSLLAKTVPHATPSKADMEEMERLIMRTRDCFYWSSKAIMKQGVVEKKSILAFSLRSCGSNLNNYLTQHLKWDATSAFRLIEAFAELELEAASASV